MPRLNQRGLFSVQRVLDVLEFFEFFWHFLVSWAIEASSAPLLPRESVASRCVPQSQNAGRPPALSKTSMSCCTRKTPCIPLVHLRQGAAGRPTTWAFWRPACLRRSARGRHALRRTLSFVRRQNSSYSFPCVTRSCEWHHCLPTTGCTGLIPT